MPNDAAALQALLDERAAFYNTAAFIAADPISLPHRFTRLQDIEIAGLFAAVLAWGHRSMILRNGDRLLGWMDHAPYDFIRNHTDADLKPFAGFAHRTFNATDLLHFIRFLQQHYQTHDTLEAAFTTGATASEETVEAALIRFHETVFRFEDAPQRTRKHVATPARASACKRLCMYLRWMVRADDRGVDFGLWKTLRPSQLICPLDVHSAGTARRLGLLDRTATDWKAALELTGRLRAFDLEDPVRYDFALFGMGAIR